MRKILLTTLIVVLIGSGMTIGISAQERTVKLLESMQPKLFIWTTAIVISNESTERSLRPNIAINTNNSIHIVWQDITNLGGAGTDNDIFYKYWNATSAK